MTTKPLQLSEIIDGDTLDRCADLAQSRDGDRAVKDAAAEVVGLAQKYRELHAKAKAANSLDSPEIAPTLRAVGEKIRSLDEYLKEPVYKHDMNWGGDLSPRSYGDPAAGVPADAGPFVKSILAAGFDFGSKSKLGVEINGYKALGLGAMEYKAPTLPTPGGWDRDREPGILPAAYDRRWIFRSLPSKDAGTSTSIDDFRVTAGVLTGTVERALDAATAKATKDSTIALTNTALAQHAVIVPDVPNQALESLDQLTAVLRDEAGFEVEKSIDTAVDTALRAVTVPNGSTGTGLPAQVRNAIASMRAVGRNPNLLILDPADAVTLDLFEDTSGQLVFATRDTGDSSPLFGLRVVESVAAVGADPFLVDTQRIGVVYIGSIKFDANPYAKFDQNLTDLRVETNAVFIRRDASAAFRIGI